VTTIGDDRVGIIATSRAGMIACDDLRWDRMLRACGDDRVRRQVGVVARDDLRWDRVRRPGGDDWVGMIVSDDQVGMIASTTGGMTARDDRVGMIACGDCAGW